MTEQEKFNELADGMEQVNREMADEIERTAPLCHMKPMCLDEADIDDYHTEKWWECSVCGHTKDYWIRKVTTLGGGK